MRNKKLRLLSSAFLGIRLLLCFLRRRLQTGSGLSAKSIAARGVDLYCLHYGRLCNRAGHYIFALWFLLSSSSFFLFSSPSLSRQRLDVYHTSTHGVALVRI